MFPCTMCGCCCRRVGEVIRVLKIDFPYGVDDKGACEKLIENKCTVYDSRPTVCRIDEIAKICGVGIEEYYKRSVEACNQMMDMDGVPEKYRIKLK